MNYLSYETPVTVATASNSQPLRAELTKTVKGGMFFKSVIYFFNNNKTIYL